MPGALPPSPPDRGRLSDRRLKVSRVISYAFGEPERLCSPATWVWSLGCFALLDDFNSDMNALITNGRLGSCNEKPNVVLPFSAESTASCQDLVVAPPQVALEYCCYSSKHSFEFGGGPRCIFHPTDNPIRSTVLAVGRIALRCELLLKSLMQVVGPELGILSRDLTVFSPIGENRTDEYP